MKIFVKAKPGIAALAQYFNLPKSNLRIVFGSAAKQKIIDILKNGAAPSQK